MNVTTARAAWHLVIPVKGGPRAKSRLNAPKGVDHGSLASAVALDTVSAAAAALTALGIHVVPDPGSGLNPAILAGLSDLRRRHRDGPTGVLLGDVPAVRPGDLIAALHLASRHRRSFVPDTGGTGTVLLAGVRPSALRPHFGSGSAAAHERAGHVRLELDLPHLRTDVDDEESLRGVLCLGVGPSTARLLADLVAPRAHEAHDRGA